MKSSKISINSFSPEILEIIFTFYFLQLDVKRKLEITPSTSSSVLPDLPVLHVCWLWRDIVLNNSRFWTEINVNFGEERMTEEYAELCLPKVLLNLNKRLELRDINRSLLNS